MRGSISFSKWKLVPPKQADWRFFTTSARSRTEKFALVRVTSISPRAASRVFSSARRASCWLGWMVKLCSMATARRMKDTVAPESNVMLSGWVLLYTVSIWLGTGVMRLREGSNSRWEAKEVSRRAERGWGCSTSSHCCISSVSQPGMSVGVSGSSGSSRVTAAWRTISCLSRSDNLLQVMIV